MPPPSTVPGALEFAAREVFVHTSRTKISADFVAFLEHLDRRYGPIPGRAKIPVVLVLDNGPIHISKASRAALEARQGLRGLAGTCSPTTFLRREGTVGVRLQGKASR